VVSHKLLQAAGGFHTLIVRGLGRPIRSYVYIHLIPVARGMDKSGIVEQFEWANPKRVQLKENAS
jgi:hypothetical protein